MVIFSTRFLFVWEINYQAMSVVIPARDVQAE